MRPWSLRFVLVSGAFFSIVFITAAIAIPAFFNFRRSIVVLWHQFSKDCAFRVAQQTLQYFADGPFFLQFTTRKTVDVHNPFDLFDYGRAALESYPHFEAISFSTESGNLYEIGYEDGRIQGVIGEPPGAIKKYTFQTNGWTLEGTATENYKLRHEHVWERGTQHPEGIWSKPYFSVITHNFQLTYIKPQIEQGKIVGIWCVDYDITKFADFLSYLQFGMIGKIFIAADDGTLLASSKKEEGSVFFTQVWQKSNQLFNHSSKPVWFDFEKYLVYVEPFPLKATIPWNVLVMAPRGEFFDPIIHQALLTAAIASICGILALVFANMFFSRVSARLKDISLEMDEIGNLIFSHSPQPPSSIREVQVMNLALDKMNIELQSFSRYVPIDLIRTLIQSGMPAKLGGDKKEMTILFSDLANFTDFSEHAPPDEIVEVLKIYLTQMSQLINENRGLIDKFIGDAIMGTWGAPFPLANHALWSCKAALAMHRQFSPQLKERGIFQRIGINSGTVIVGNIGSPDRMDYTVIGDAVNVAKRLEGLNKYYGTNILIGENTAELVSSEMLLRPLDRVTLKGRKQGILVYELITELKGADPKLVSATKMFQSALEALWQRQFDEALRRFQQTNELFGGRDKPSQRLAERANLYGKNSPPDDWDGSFIIG